MSAEQWFAGLGLLVCVGLLVRMALPERWRWRLDHELRNAWAGCRGAGLRAWRWRRHRRRASSEADAAIRRARGEVTREGNVVRPKSFKRPRKPH